MAEFAVQGVPMALARDGWWFDDTQAEPSRTQAPERRRGGGLLALAALVMLADVLFWQQAGPGLSLALFLVAIGGVLRGFGRIGRRDLGLLVVVLGVLPLVERVQALSIGFGVLGVIGYAVWLQAGQVGLILARLPRVFGLMPQGVSDAVQAMRAVQRQAVTNGGLIRGLRAAVLPLGLGLCFAGLLLMANPVLASWLSAGGAWPNPARGLFWGGLALMIWPVLRTPQSDLRGVEVVLPRWGFGGVINAGAVTTSLWLFNAMFAVQTAMDAAYLWGGVALPQGMSHAEYAHRGAYPLVVTALLAGVFALISKTYAAERRLVRGLLLIWIGQNVALVASSLLRLRAYVEAYGLTYLRLDAAIWMGVVAAGLAMLAWSVLRGRTNGWLALRCGALAAAVLYGACFVNFAQVIASHNLSAPHSRADLAYVCGLGSDAWAALRHSGAVAGCASVYGASDGFDYGIDVTAPRIEGWRDWSYRSYRILEQANAYSDRGR